MKTTIPLAIPTFDNTAITFDTVNFTFDGACLANGGASDIKRKGVSQTISVPLFVPLYGTNGVNAPFPILYPPQTFYVNGVAITV